MDLYTQINSLLFSFFYGIFISVSLILLERFIYNDKKATVIVSSFMISMILCLLYFILILKINNGIIHPYFVFMVLLGYFIERKFLKLVKRINFFVKQSVKK